MNEVRERWLADAPGAFDWRVVVIGGAWTLEHRGVAADAMKAVVREGGDAEAFAVQNNLGKGSKSSET